MEQIATIRKVSVVTDKDNNLLASVLLTFPVMDARDKENLFELIRMQNEDVEFNCVSRQISLIEHSVNREDGNGDKD